jgi:hypothetical protein
VTPFVAMSVIFFMSVLGIAIDMMIDFQAVNQLEFAAQTAAFYGLSLTTPPDSSAYTQQSAETRIQTAIVNNSALWNVAPSGPQNAQAVVSFAGTDIAFVPNPQEPNSATQEFFLQVTGRRAGQSALTQIFLPLVYTSMSAPGVPPQVAAMSPFRTVEAIGQPASRIGPGAPLTSRANTRSADLVRFATFPLALNYSQFQLHSRPGLPTGTYSLDLVNSFSTRAAANHVQAAFVDVSSNPGGSNGFGGGANPTTLQELLQYFGGNIRQNLPPAAVERGNTLNLFSVQTASKNQVVQALTQTLIKNGAGFDYLLPVLQGTTVVGFARVQLKVIAGATNGIPNMTVMLDNSLPCRNASSATGASANPATLGQALPPPVSPFTARSVDPATNNLTARSPGVVLAPALSPRLLPHPSVPTNPTI